MNSTASRSSPPLARAVAATTSQATDSGTITDRSRWIAGKEEARGDRFRRVVGQQPTQFEFRDRDRAPGVERPCDPGSEHPDRSHSIASRTQHRAGDQPGCGVGRRFRFEGAAVAQQGNLATSSSAPRRVRYRSEGSASWSPSRTRPSIDRSRCSSPARSKTEAISKAPRVSPARSRLRRATSSRLGSREGRRIGSPGCSSLTRSGSRPGSRKCPAAASETRVWEMVSRKPAPTRVSRSRSVASSSGCTGVTWTAIPSSIGSCS